MKCQRKKTTKPRTQKPKPARCTPTRNTGPATDLRDPIDPIDSIDPIDPVDPLDPIEAALEQAARIAAPYPEEVAAVENVREFLRGYRSGVFGALSRADVLLVLSILITAMDREPTPTERATFAMIDSILGSRPAVARPCPWPPFTPPPFSFPSRPCVPAGIRAGVVTPCPLMPSTLFPV